MSSCGESSQTPVSSVRKGAGGRPQDPIRQEFITIEGSSSSSSSSNRPAAQCKHCNQVFTTAKAKVEALRKHITSDCSAVPSETRAKWQARLAGKGDSTAGEDAVRAGKKRKPDTDLQQTDIRRRFASDKFALTKEEEGEVGRHFLRFLVCSNIPFSAVNSPHLAHGLQILRPGFVLPGPTTFKERLLHNEYLAVSVKLTKRIEEAENLTLAVDGWTDKVKRAIMAFVLLFPDRTAALLDVKDTSDIIHTAENLADMIKAVIDKHKIRCKLALLVTDNAANMAKARRLVVETRGYMHVLEMRCMMHGFNLVLGSILAFPWAQQLVVNAQRLVTYFRASHRPLAMLRKGAEQFGVTKSLHSSNKTRFTSTHECISSVLANRNAFNYVLATDRDVIKSADVLGILEDPSFWRDLPKLDKLLAPLTKVITAVQSNKSTLADVCRYWLYLAHGVGAVLNDLPSDYQRHIIWAVSTRAKQQDSVLCRLALFLDPRFRRAASSGPTGRTEFIIKASSFCHAQGWEADKLNAMLEQLVQYGDGVPPFNTDLAAGGISTAFSSRSWWASVGTHAAAAAVAEMAIVLLDVVPHAAEPERVFSKLGWYESGKVTRLSTTVAMQKAAIKLHYDAVKPAVQRKQQQHSMPEVEVVDLSGPAHIAAAALSDPAAAAAAEEAAAAQRSSAGTPQQEAGPGDSDVTAEELEGALQQQAEADQAEKQAEQVHVPEECRTSWRAAQLWSMGVVGADLLDPTYHETLLSAPQRIIKEAAAGVDPAALAAAFIARQRAAAAAAAADEDDAQQ